jgi:hypothetical protein
MLGEVRTVIVYSRVFLGTDLYPFKNLTLQAIQVSWWGILPYGESKYICRHECTIVSMVNYLCMTLADFNDSIKVLECYTNSSK